MTKYSKRKVFKQGSSLCVTVPSELKDVFREGMSVVPMLTDRGLLFALEDVSHIEKPQRQITPRTTPTQPVIEPQPEHIVEPQQIAKKPTCHPMEIFAKETVDSLFGLFEKKKPEQEPEPEGL